MADFIPGLNLSELFFRDAIRPILARHFPSLAYSAALIHTGSDVLGFDTPMSRDHGWGPRCMLFLAEPDYGTLAPQIGQVLGEELPFEFLGYPTNFVYTDSPCMRATDRRPINHWVEVTTVGRFFRDYIGFDPREPVGEADWLTTPSQKLRTIRSGNVFHDGLDELASCRRALHCYPHDLWLYLMACQWQRISQEEAFVGRTGDVGDELGSRVIATRIVEDLMKLCFLIEQQFPPYSKWLGTAFARLTSAAQLVPVFDRVLTSDTWNDRELHLSRAYLIVQNLHNALAVTDPQPVEVGPFHERPYRVPHAGRFADALYASVRSDAVKRLPKHVGAVWQFSNSTDVLDDVARCRAVAHVIRASP